MNDGAEAVPEDQCEVGRGRQCPYMEGRQIAFLRTGEAGHRRRSRLAVGASTHDLPGCHACSMGGLEAGQPAPALGFAEQMASAAFIAELCVERVTAWTFSSLILTQDRELRAVVSKPLCRWVERPG